MIKKMIFVSIVCFTVLAVSACATPGSTPNTTVPVNTSPATGGAPPSTGIPSIAPTPPTQGNTGTGIATPVAPSPNVAVSAPGAGYVTSPSILNNG